MHTSRSAAGDAHTYAGDSVKLSFSLAYTPPEVAVESEKLVEYVVATEAADMWALGVVAYQLLTGAAVLQPYRTTKVGILECLAGRKALPWEVEGWAKSSERKALGGLKGGVMACLQRDPRQRPVAASVRQSWSRLFEWHSTQGGSEAANTDGYVA